MPASAQSVSIETIHRGCITQVGPARNGAAECILKQGAPVVVPAFVATYLGSGDEIEIPFVPDQAGTEIHVRKNGSSRRLRELYQAQIGCVAHPKEDKRGDAFVAAEVAGSRLGIRSIHLPCRVVRDYFYVADRQREWDKQGTFYEVVRAPHHAGPAELRLAFKIRQIELQKERAPKSACRALERAYNILARAELRACYDTLLADADSPVLFPYGGFGLIFVSGDRSRDGQTSFATRLLAFRPEMYERRFHAPLRKFDFYNQTAVYRDSRRKLEVIVDQCAMPVVWDKTWNQWKYLLAAKVEINGAFVRSGNRRMKFGEWHHVEWETALPSRVNVTLPVNLQEQLDAARTCYHRFGQYSNAFDRIRARIEREPVEMRELDRLLGEHGVPGDFDVSQLTWKSDYDSFFYKELSKRARRLYLFQSEFIFDVANGVVVETPQQGHATYVFSKPQSMESFLALYTRVSKEDIRENRKGIAMRLGFVGRIVHGVNAQCWAKEIRENLDEPVYQPSSQ
jgi:hypothetical protein